MKMSSTLTSGKKQYLKRLYWGKLDISLSRNKMLR
jgi:hypothetical protein